LSADTLPSPHLIEKLAELGISAMTRLDLWTYFKTQTGGTLSGAIPPDMTADRLAELAIQLARMRR
jgi:hypothetical protein